MKIDRGPACITELKIREIDALVVGQTDVMTVLDPDGCTALTLYTLDEVRALRDALSEVLTILGEPDKPETASPGVGPWERIEDVPMSVKSVRDKDGDRWEWDPTDPPGYFASEPYAYLNRYGPFRPEL